MFLRPNELMTKIMIRLINFIHINSVGEGKNASRLFQAAGKLNKCERKTTTKRDLFLLHVINVELKRKMFYCNFSLMRMILLHCFEAFTTHRKVFSLANAIVASFLTSVQVQGDKGSKHEVLYCLLTQCHIQLKSKSITLKPYFN